MYGTGFIAKLAVSLSLAIELKNLRRVTSAVALNPSRTVTVFSSASVFQVLAVLVLSVGCVPELVANFLISQINLSAQACSQ